MAKAGKPAGGPATAKAKPQKRMMMPGLPRSAGATMKRPSAAKPTLARKGYGA